MCGISAVSLRAKLTKTQLRIAKNKLKILHYARKICNWNDSEFCIFTANKKLLKKKDILFPDYLIHSEVLQMRTILCSHIIPIILSLLLWNTNG